MKFTKFQRLKKALERLEVNPIGRRIHDLEAQLQGRGLVLDPKNTAIIQEGIFYIEPDSGIATKVVAYNPNFVLQLDKQQKKQLLPDGYPDEDTISTFHSYHLMRCNLLAQAEKGGWEQPFRLSGRNDAQFYFRLVSDSNPRSKAFELYQEIERQRLFVCPYCLLKVSNLIISAQGQKREAFVLKTFFDVDFVRAWNSHGLLSKDYGFTRDMYPEDWKEICRIRKEQVRYQCEACFVDLSEEVLRRYLHVQASDHIEGKQGYVRLECFCVGCVAEQATAMGLPIPEQLTQYLNEMKRRKTKEYQPFLQRSAPSSPP